MKRLVLIFYFTAQAVTLFAEEPPVMVVTGAKIEQSEDETVEAVEVITSEEIAGKGAKTLAEALEGIPGIVIYDHPQSTVMMQGFEGSYVKILIDGMEIAGDTGGATPVGMIPVADIERIEIVRGASSALYGSDAMGGVINIITKKPETDKFSLKTRHEFASNLRYYGDLFAGYANKYFSISGNASFDYGAGKKETVKTGGKNVEIFKMPSERLASARLNASLFYNKGEIGIYGGWMNSLLKLSADKENGYDFLNNRFEAGANFKHAFLDTAILDGYFKFDHLNYDADRISYVWNTTGPYAESVFQDLEGEAKFAWDPLIDHSFLFGFNLKHESLDSDTFSDTKRSMLASLFAQDIWNIGARDILRITPGLRLSMGVPQSKDEDIRLSLTPKLALRYDPLERIILRFSYGMGFKSPTLKERYWVFFHPTPYNFLIQGNPNLKPESSHGINASAEWKPLDALAFQIGGYFNYLFDMIDVEEVPGTEDGGTMIGADGQEHHYLFIYRYRNVGRAMTAGGDFSVRYKTKSITAAFTYTIALAKEWNSETEAYQDMASRVPHQITLHGAYLIPVIETEASLRLNWNAPQIISAEEKTYTPDYFMVNLQFSKKFFGEKLEVYLGAKNLLHNLHFIKSADGENQRDYFGLKDGITFYLGGIFKW
jgi:outer membrane receptor for ferrienterochelin and colicins